MEKFNYTPTKQEIPKEVLSSMTELKEIFLNTCYSVPVILNTCLNSNQNMMNHSISKYEHQPTLNHKMSSVISEAKHQMMPLYQQSLVPIIAQ